MLGKTTEDITARARTSSYDNAAWVLLVALIAVLAVLWNSAAIAGRFAAEQSSIGSIEDYIALGALVAEVTIFLVTFIVLARKSCFKRKSTWTVAMVTYFGCFTLGAITLIAIGLANIHYNC